MSFSAPGFNAGTVNVLKQKIPVASLLTYGNVLGTWLFSAEKKTKIRESNPQRQS